VYIPGGNPAQPIIMARQRPSDEGRKMKIFIGSPLSEECAEGLMLKANCWKLYQLSNSGCFILEDWIW